MLLLHPCSQRSDQLRRSGVLTVLESALLLYRALLSAPVWFKFFEEQHIGSILCSSCTGVPVRPEKAVLYLCESYVCAA